MYIFRNIRAELSLRSKRALVRVAVVAICLEGLENSRQGALATLDALGNVSPRGLDRVARAQPRVLGALGETVQSYQS